MHQLGLRAILSPVPWRSPPSYPSIQAILNPITLSADGELLYFSAMNERTWYQVPARLLREDASDADISAAIEKAGLTHLSDGASTDTAGNHYFTD